MTNPSNPDRMDFAQWLITYRARVPGPRGETRKSLAAKIGVSPRTIQNWETGSLPSLENLRKLVGVLAQLGVFTPGKELEEATILWATVKGPTDARSETGREFPGFDKNWFLHLHQTQLKGFEVSSPPIGKPKDKCDTAITAKTLQTSTSTDPAEELAQSQERQESPVEEDYQAFPSSALTAPKSEVSHGAGDWPPVALNASPQLSPGNEEWVRSDDASLTGVSCQGLFSDQQTSSCKEPQQPDPFKGKQNWVARGLSNEESALPPAPPRPGAWRWRWRLKALARYLEFKAGSRPSADAIGSADLRCRRLRRVFLVLAALYLILILFIRVFYLTFETHKPLDPALAALDSVTVANISQNVAVSMNKTTLCRGEPARITFTLKNNGTVPTRLGELLDGMRRSEEDWGKDFYEHSSVYNIILSPQQTYTYDEVQSFSKVGEFSMEPIVRIGDHWGGIPDTAGKFPTVTFTVVDCSRVRLA